MLPLLRFRNRVLTGIVGGASVTFVRLNRSSAHCENKQESPVSIFNFKMVDINGKEMTKERLKGKTAVLIVNVACEWGLTNTNYEELVKLYKKYEHKGLEILAFPCNTFNQENGTDREIKEYVAEKGVTFPLMAKVDCGFSAQAHPIFPFLCEKLADSGAFGFLGNGIKWNFTKFLVDGSGVPIKRFGPRVHPLALENDIVALIKKGKKAE